MREAPLEVGPQSSITAEEVGRLVDLRKTVAAERRKYHLDSQG